MAIFWHKSPQALIGANRIHPQTKFPDGAINEPSGVFRFENHILIVENKTDINFIRESCKRMFETGEMKELGGQEELKEVRQQIANAENRKVSKAKKKETGSGEIDDIGEDVVDETLAGATFDPSV